MSKREYLLQKGRQIQQLNEEAAKPSSTPSVSREKIAQLRGMLPPNVDDNQILQLLQDTKGDQAKITAAVDEMWELKNRGNDDWATVSKKGKKKTEPSSSRGPSSQQNQSSGWGESAQGVSTGERSSNRGRGGSRGRGMARGGRSGRGRGRGPPGSGRGNRVNGENAGEETTEKDANGAVEQDGASPPEHEKSNRNRGHTREGGSKKPKQTEPVVAPPVVNPVLTGAWTKKPNLGGIGEKPKPAPKPVPKPVQESPKPVVKPASPKKTAEEVNAPAPQSPRKSPKKEKTVSPRKSPSPKKETVVENAAIGSGWGSLDVSGSSIGEWGSSTEPKKSASTNAWSRGSPIISSAASNDTKSPIPTVVPGSPKDIQVPRPDSRSGGSASSSPKQYLRMGKWEAAATTNLSLQFGSFSLNGVEHVESTSPRGWGTASTPSGSKSTAQPSESGSAWGTQTSPKKTVPLSPSRPLNDADQVSVQSQIGSQIGSDAGRKGAATSSAAPPGLSVEAGGVTPKANQSPRNYAPTAPSPASLPKPDDVKRSTPTRGQGHFQSQQASQGQGQAKLNIGSSSSYASDFSKSSGLYQSAYGQYSMDLVGRNNGAPNQSNIQANAGTPKGSGSRNVPSGSAIASGSTQSPSHGAQQSQAAGQLQQLQMQMQQPPQQSAQQAQQPQQAQQKQQPQQGQSAQQPQTQAQAGQTPGSQQPPQNHPQYHLPGPQGYHPHYAPPPPPGMAMPYNPYNYAGYYQGYGYYQNPQYPQYSPRTQYPPRGSIPYGMEGPIPGFSNPPSMPVGYQDQHLLPHQHDYAGGIPQGFGDISGAYLQPGQHQQNAPHHGSQQGAQQGHSKGANPMAGAQQSHPQRGNANMPAYSSSAGSSAREPTNPPVPNTSAGMSSGSHGGQPYGWASYGGQPVGGWGHMMPQNYQQSPAQHQHPGSHQSSYRQQYNNASGASASSANETGSGSHGHGHSSWSS